jgi:ribonuclease HI
LIRIWQLYFEKYFTAPNTVINDSIIFIIKIQEEEEREEVEQARIETDSSRVDKALNEMNISTAKEAHQLARTRAVENKDQLCEISRALAVLSSASVRFNI